MYVLEILRNIWGGGVWLNNWGFICIYFCEDFLIKCFGVDFVKFIVFVYVCLCFCGNIFFCNGVGFYFKSF